MIDKPEARRFPLPWIAEEIPVANMLATEPHRIATAQAGVEHHVQPYPLPRADRPALLVCGDVVLSPRAETVALWALRISTPAVRSTLTMPASSAQRKRPRMAREEVADSLRPAEAV